MMSVERDDAPSAGLWSSTFRVHSPDPRRQ